MWTNNRGAVGISVRWAWEGGLGSAGRCKASKAFGILYFLRSQACLFSPLAEERYGVIRMRQVRKATQKAVAWNCSFQRSAGGEGGCCGNGRGGWVMICVGIQSGNIWIGWAGREIHKSRVTLHKAFSITNRVNRIKIYRDTGAWEKIWFWEKISRAHALFEAPVSHSQGGCQLGHWISGSGAPGRHTFGVHQHLGATWSCCSAWNYGTRVGITSFQYQTLRNLAILGTVHELAHWEGGDSKVRQRGFREERSLSKKKEQSTMLNASEKGIETCHWVEKNARGWYLSASGLLSYCTVYPEVTSQGFSATLYQMELLLSATPRVAVCTFTPSTSVVLPTIPSPVAVLSMLSSQKTWKGAA